MPGLIEILPCEISSISFNNDGLPIITNPKTKNSLQQAANLLRSGQLCAFPTETVYGLGASITSRDAVRAIFETKGRPPDNPLIVHVSDLTMLKEFLTEDLWRRLPRAYQPLMNKFWPGPLSFLVPLPLSNIAPEVHAGLPTLVVRLPRHPVARALIHLSGIPIAAPSANSSGRPSPTTAEHVQKDMMTKHNAKPGWGGLTILDGGPCGVGVESTVVDGLSRDSNGRECLRVLRLGGVGPDILEAELKVAGLEDVNVLVYKRDWEDESLQSRPSTPGMKYRHYAPDAQVIFVNPLVINADGSSQGSMNLQTSSTVSLDGLIKYHIDDSSSPRNFRPDGLGFLIPNPSNLAEALERRRTDHPDHLLLAQLGSTVEQHAQNLFASLRSLDAQGAKVIFVERPADGSWDEGVGLAVAERLEKAAAMNGISHSPSILYVTV